MAEGIEILDDAQAVKNIDKSGMLALIDEMPSMMEKAWAAASAVAVPALKKISAVVIAGMGGSAISGDIVSAVLRDRAGVPVIVNRSYTIPAFVDENTLFICASYSGNTEETLSCLKEALKKKAKIVCVSSGGELKKSAAKNGLPFLEVPAGFPPRAALGYLLPCVLNVVSRAGIADGIDLEISETIKLLKELSREFGLGRSSRENPAKQLAVKLSGKVPMILSSVDTTSSAALRWKTQINENGKMTAALAVFPELSHNDMINFSALKPGQHDLSFLALRDEGDVERMKKRIEITKSMVSHRVGGIIEVWSRGKSLLERIMSLIIFGDYLSVYLALLSGVDPTPVEVIERLKKELQR